MVQEIKIMKELLIFFALTLNIDHLLYMVH
jgi:hypothetical protein